MQDISNPRSGQSELIGICERNKATALRRQALDELDKLWEVLRGTIQDRREIKALWSQVDAVLKLLESANGEGEDTYGLDRSVTIALRGVLGLSADHRDNFEVLDLVIRCTSLTLDSSSESEQALGPMLYRGIFSHLQQLEAQSPNSFRHLEAVLEYQARAESLGLGGNNNVDVPRRLTAIAKVRFEQLNDLSKRKLNEGTSDSKATAERLSKRPKVTHEESTSNTIMDLDIGLECMTQALTLGQESAEDLPASLQLLALFHQKRSYLPLVPSKSIAHIDKAIENQCRSLALTQHNHPEYEQRALILAMMYIGRSVLGTEGITDLRKALELHPHALLLTPDDKEAFSNHLTQAEAIERQVGTGNDLQDVNEAITALSRACRCFSLDPFPFQAALLSRMGALYQKVFLRLGELNYINQAIDYHQKALLLTSEKQGENSPYLLALIQSLSLRAHCLRDPNRENLGHGWLATAPHLGLIELFSFVDGIRSFEPRAASGLPVPVVPLTWLEYALQKAHTWNQELRKDHEDAPLYFAYLGRLYLEKFNWANEMSNLQNAIEHMEQAVSFQYGGQLRFVRWLDQLAMLYDRRFAFSHDAEDLERGTECAIRALSLLPPNHSDQPEYYTTLGVLYSHKASLGGSDRRGNAAKTQAEDYFRQASYCDTGCPFSRLEAAMTWVSQSTATGWEDQTAEAFEAVKDILPRVSWLRASSNSQFEGLRPITDLARNAAAWYISRGRFQQALEWMEQGRSMTYGHRFELRPVFDKLQSASPSLSDKLHQLREELYLTTEQTAYPETTGNKRTQLAGEFNQLIEEARAVPSCGNLLLPMSGLELISAVQAGPIAMINTAQFNCDALILTPWSDKIMHIPLPDASVQKLVESVDILEGCISRRHGQCRGVRKGKQKEESNSDFEKVLNFLWSAIAKPILGALGYIDNTPTKELPRLTWCTMGLLSSLPLHAAGYYDGSRSKVSDFVVSSYTPTLSALLPTSSASRAQHSELLAVGQEHSLNRKVLPHTKQELAVIKKYVKQPIAISQLDGIDVSCEIALEVMEMCDWVHLACHTHHDVCDPTASGFVLQDGILSLHSIAQKSFKNKGLAFLSGCDVAGRDDTAVSLASGMLITGYRSVIATMWGVEDEDAPVIANEVYGRLFRNGNMNHKDSARALHAAVNELRLLSGNKDFIRWVPYIHIGA
ncbi:unnamed protein product [Rhizoctonia solani]|uniref:CHAT domain-containing protein n=1 Tax=Rhizoctonia solani TaxID=456999 RepID=A0A8H3D275_9AGAM|nr:unnamed protein product [Rhizoctonia solani]